MPRSNWMARITLSICSIMLGFFFDLFDFWKNNLMITNYNIWISFMHSYHQHQKLEPRIWDKEDFTILTYRRAREHQSSLDGIIRKWVSRDDLIGIHEQYPNEIVRTELYSRRNLVTHSSPTLESEGFWFISLLPSESPELKWLPFTFTGQKRLTLARVVSYS